MRRITTALHEDNDINNTFNIDKSNTSATKENEFDGTLGLTDDETPDTTIKKRKYKINDKIENSKSFTNNTDTFFPFPIQSIEPKRFEVLKHSVCYVVDINKEEGIFTAKSLYNENLEIKEEMIEFLLDDLKESQRKSLIVGQVFDWYIGYLYAFSGKRRVSEIEFSLPFKRTQRELDIIHHNAGEMSRRLSKNAE